jgi:lipopolysaccharide/colanic/teichoic acid biosynthesis glycosyltransferase
MSFITYFHRRAQSLAKLIAPAQHTASPCDFTTTVCRERARADRSGDEFSVVTFTAANGVLRQIGKHLIQRARIIDQYGWTEEGRLWLLLPHCPPNAAAMIARDICELFCAGREQASYDLYHYAGGTKGTRNNRSCQKSHSEHDPVEQSGTCGRTDATPSESPDERHQAVEPLVARAMPYSKRTLDILLASVALIVFAPVLAAVSVLIKVTSTGPVFFGQVRAGRTGEPFRMFKFRTMVVDAEQLKSQLLAHNEQDGPAFKMKKDPRITRVGRVLRATGIDELPQLWNVLRGEMSVVGPRPLPLSEAADCAPWQQERLDITPGLTCWWQVSDRWSNVPFADWMRMDISYARRRSLATDLKLILRTIAFVIRRKGT